jgi:hypothetical protein
VDRFRCFHLTNPTIIVLIQKAREVNVGNVPNTKHVGSKYIVRDWGNEHRVGLWSKV